MGPAVGIGLALVLIAVFLRILAMIIDADDPDNVDWAAEITDDWYVVPSRSGSGHSSSRSSR